MADVSPDEVVNAVRQNIADSQNYADTAVNKAFNYLDNAVFSANNTYFLGVNSNPAPSVSFGPLADPWNISMIPSVNADASLDYRNGWMSKYRELMDEHFSGLFSFDLAETKLQDILNNGYIVNRNINNQIVSRVIDNETIKSFALKDKATTDFLSKGWNIPNSIIINRLDAIDKDYSEQVSSAIRDIALKEEDLNTDMLKFAMDSALKLKPQCVQIASDFASKYSQMYSFSSEGAKTYMNGLSIINDSINNYNRIILSRSQIGLGDVQESKKFDLATKSAQATFELDKIKLKTSTALGAAESVSRIGAAAVSSQLSMAQLYAGTNTGT